MANVVINDKYLADIADAIRSKNYTAETYKPREMAAAIINLPSGDTASFGNFMSKTLQGTVTVDAEVIGPYALSHNEFTSLQTNATTIEVGGCSQCTQLVSVAMPNLTSIGNSAFRYCPKLTSISIPGDVELIGQNAFALCYSLADVDIEGDIADIGAYAFSGCSSLTELKFPGKVSIMRNWALNGATGEKDPPITKIDFNHVVRLEGDALGDASEETALRTIIIRNTSQPVYCSEDALCAFPAQFQNTYRGSNPGYIYVPAAMVDAYKNYKEDVYSGKYDTVARCSSHIRAIEAYPDICG